MRRDSLPLLYARYERRSRELSDRFRASLLSSFPCESIHPDGRLYLLCRLQALWGEFSRELIVRSALGGCRTRRGVILAKAPGVNNMADIRRALGKTMLQSPGMYWEDPKSAVMYANALKVNNYQEISKGLASAKTEDIKSLRNFIVHPNAWTRLRYEQVARNLRMSGMSPDRMLSQPIPGGATLFESWVHQLLIAAWNSVE